MNDDILHVKHWPDEAIDAVGFHPRSGYFEWCWLPSLGPTAAWSYLRLVTLLAGDPTVGVAPQPDGFDVSISVLARCMGLGTGHDSRFKHTLDRLAKFELALSEGDNLSVRGKVPWLNRRQLRRLPPELLAMHTALLAQHDEARLG